MHFFVWVVQWSVLLRLLIVWLPPPEPLELAIWLALLWPIRFSRVIAQLASGNKLHCVCFFELEYALTDYMKAEEISVTLFRWEMVSQRSCRV